MAILAVSLLLVGLGLIWASWNAARSGGQGPSAGDHSAVAWPRSPWENARPGVAYVGDAVCTRCHAEIAETFRRHPMGRSLAPVSDATGTVGGEGPEGPADFESAGSRFVVERRGGQVIHRETRTDEHGKVLAQVEAAVQYAVGSGTRGVSFLLEHDGRLYQSPISWYSQERRWAPSPGYESDNLHFNRPIEPRCLFCHTNRVEPVEQTPNRYREPIFRGHTIGCERCHGPGELHVRRPGLVDGRDPTIVNPKHLEPALRVDVCVQCHVLGSQRIERPGRELFDYRPGLPTAAFFAIYGYADAGRNNVVGHVEQMKISRCFRESRGQMDCTSCHDPHRRPAPEEKTESFRRQCLACHEQKGCKLAEPIPPRPEPGRRLRPVSHAEVREPLRRARRDHGPPDHPVARSRADRAGAVGIRAPAGPPERRRPGPRGARRRSTESWRSPWRPRGRGCPRPRRSRGSARSCCACSTGSWRPGPTTGSPAG